MELGKFLELPTAEVARLVQAAGPKVCVFPINGTRRWFILEHGAVAPEDFARAYLEVAIPAHIRLYELIFTHGIDTLITPAFGPDLLDRGPEYAALAIEGLGSLATHPAFLEFYAALDIRVRFYGDYRKYLTAHEYLPLLEKFDRVTERTARHGTNRLFFGLFAHNATETVAELAIHYYLAHNHAPDTRTLIERYYGEYVRPVDLFVGFDMPCVFDMPLIADGTEDLYFTVSPSLYLTEGQWRAILYDHLYARSNDQASYQEMAADDWALMQDFYRTNMGNTIGIGARHGKAGIWYPLPQVSLPESFAHSQPSPQSTTRS
ncbi:MAG: diterpene synthase [Anaerolineae bacterium]|nr:diterpene synthase [Anaerolineae bacterium]